MTTVKTMILTEEQQRLVDEIMRRESPQAKVDAMVDRARASMVAEENESST